MQTGKDIYGKKYPIFFQALDDYKPGLALYTSIPGIYFLGLNDLGVRIASVVFGSLIPVLVFALASLIYGKNKRIAYAVAIMAVFSPWSIQLSRAMIWYPEVVFFYLCFFTLFFYSIKYNFKYIILSGVLLSLTLYTYYAAFIYLPFISLVLFLLYKKQLFEKLKYTLIAAITFLILSIPAVTHYLTPESRSRLNAISVLTPDITLPISISEIKSDQEKELPFSKIIHNRRFVYASSMAETYIKYFNLDYLFVNSKNVRYFYINYVGLFYLVELPFVVYGLLQIVKRRSKSDILILSLVLIAPIPAMFTLGTSFIHRALLLLISVQFISAIGIVSLLDHLKKYYLFLSLIFAFSVYFFLHQYFIHSGEEFTSEKDNGAWFSTVREVIPLVNERKANYDKVVFTWSSGKLVPGAYFAFYNKTNPTIFHRKAAQREIDTLSYKRIYNEIENIQFRHISWERDSKLKNTLFVGYPEEFPKDIDNVVAKTHLPNGEVHFLLVENR